MTVFVSHLIIPPLEYEMSIPEFFELIVEFSLLLLNSLMVHFIKILFFEELFIGPFGSFCDDDGLVELILQSPDFSFILLVLLVFERNPLDALNHNSLLQRLVPLLLKIVEGFSHFVLNEEVP